MHFVNVFVFVVVFTFHSQLHNNIESCTTRILWWINVTGDLKEFIVQLIYNIINLQFTVRIGTFV